MKITILTIGKRHEPWVEPGIGRFLERLRAPFAAEMIILPHSGQIGDRARQEGDELLDGDQHSRLPRGEPEVRAREQGQDEVNDLLGAAGQGCAVEDPAAPALLLQWNRIRRHASPTF